MTEQSRPPLLTTAHTRVEQGIRVKAKVDKRLSGKMVMSTLCPPHPPTPSIHIIFVIITTTKPALCVGKQTWWNFWGTTQALRQWAAAWSGVWLFSSMQSLVYILDLILVWWLTSMQSLENIVRFSGNKLFSVNLFYILEISLTCSLNLYPPLFGAFEEQQFLECTSLLSALQSWFLPMSSVCCDSPSLPFCQVARALWRFLNPPNNNRPLKKPLGFCANQVAQPKTFSYLSLGWELAKCDPVHLLVFQHICTILRKTKNL